MAGKNIDDRLKALEAEAAELEKKRMQLKAKQRELNKSIMERNRRDRAHRLIEIGAAVESVYGSEISHDEIKLLIAYLKDQEDRGRFFSKALGKDSNNQKTSPEHPQNVEITLSDHS